MQYSCHANSGDAILPPKDCKFSMQLQNSYNKKRLFFFSYTYVTHKYKTQEPSNDFFNLHILETHIQKKTIFWKRW